VFEALGIDSADVEGFDLGGMFAGELASLLHDRVRKLVLVAPFGLWLDEAQPVDFFGLPLGELPGVFFADPESPVAKAYFAQPESQEDLLEYTVQRSRALAASSKFLWPIPDRGLAKRLHRIRAETLVAWGTKDALMPPLYGECFAQVIPNARLETVEGGHMLHLEEPERLAEVVRGFLA
jgi:pimeloyl-ACP methyl ester carboxylesterase